MKEVALITGASSGLGKEYSYQLAKKGYNLIIVARSETKLHEIAADMEKQYECTVSVVSVDLTTEEGRAKVVNIIYDTEHLFYLINNAGFGLPKRFLDVPYHKHQAMIDLHVSAVTELSYAAMKKFVPKNKGTIINVASVAAFIGSGMYSGTKRFQVMLSKKLAEIAQQNDADKVRVQALCPGYISTGFHYTDEYEGIDVMKKIPKWLWLDKKNVVEGSLEKAKSKKVVYIPSFKYKLASFLGRLGLISR